MNLTINGETQISSAETLGALVAQLGMKPDRVAIELNREIVPREHWAQTPLHEGDRLEVVHFVGGGTAAARGYARLMNCHPEQSEGSAVRRKRHTHRKFGNPFRNLLT
jgi:sulfur carrier protein